MKVFLSWSGHKSHQVALVLRDWIPSVIQSIMPYVSSEDIDKGARWSTDIAKELEDSTFGILCVNKDNIEAPWLLFEAGVLSKMIDKSSVCPFLFDLKRAEVKGPILQFQSTIFEKDDVLKLMLTINKCCGESNLKEEKLKKSFDVWWPELEELLNKIKNEKFDEPIKTKDKNINNEMLEEILELTRANQKILRSPEMLFPPEYLDAIYKERIDGGLNEKDICLQLDLILESENRLKQMKNNSLKYISNNGTFDVDFNSDILRNIDGLLNALATMRNGNENFMSRRRKYKSKQLQFFNFNAG